MKQLSRVAALFLFLCTCWIQPVAASDIRITLDDQPITFDAAPFIEKDRVLVPVRGILESLGYTIHWQEHSKSVLALNEDTTIVLKIDSQDATVNGTPVKVAVPAKTVDGRTYVPLRFLAVYSGAEVHWNENTSTVSIYTKETSAEHQMKRSVVYIQTNKMQGSGIILSSDGIIATNYHVIENASTAQFVFSDGSIYQGETTVIGLAPAADIAILKIDKSDLPAAETGKKYKIGDTVTAIGSPIGQRNKVTTGVIEDFDPDTISTTAIIGQGSSGGGLFNSKGQLIGMTYSYTESHGGKYFSIPITKILQVPQNTSIPLSQLEYFVYSAPAPQNLKATLKKDGYAYVSWTPIYGAEYYHVYVSNHQKKDFHTALRTAEKTDKWYWGFPQCFAIARKSDDIYMKITAVVNGQETDFSNVLKIRGK